jgi:hypothetical protein
MRVDDLTLAALDPDGDDRSLPALLSRRAAGKFPVDEWGFDPELTLVVSSLATLRWSVEVRGGDRVPELGAALILHNRRPSPADQLALAVGLARATGRPLRFTGVPDRSPLLPALRRIGGVPGDEADLRSLFRMGELVAAPFARVLRHPFGLGRPNPEAVAAAMEAGVPILPVAIEGPPPGRRRTVHVGAPISTRRRRSALAADEVAESVRRRVEDLVAGPS